MVYVYSYARCCAATCKNTLRNSRHRGVMFCRIPKDERGKVWLERAGRHDLLNLDPLELYEKKRLCSVHFDDSQFVTRHRQRLNWKAMPTIFCCHRKDEHNENHQGCTMPLIGGNHGRPPDEKGRELASFKISDNTCVVVEDINNESPASGDKFLAAEEVIVVCFVCSQVLSPGLAVHLNAPAEASNSIHQCLELILNLKDGVADHEVVCRRCSSLLNHINRMEEELKVLKDAISTCTKAKGKNFESVPEMKNCVQILDRFSQCLGEKQYVMSLEDIITLKRGKNTDLKENSVENVEDGIGGNMHDDDQHSGEVIPEVFTKNCFDNGEKIHGDISEVEVEVSCDKEGITTENQGNVYTTEVTCNVDFSRKIVVSEEQSVAGVAKVRSHLNRNKTAVTNTVLVKNTSGHLGCIGKPFRTQHMKNKWRRIAPKICHTAIESKQDSVIKFGEKPSSVIGDDETNLLIRPKTHVCQICSFETNYQSVMIFHLRLHKKKGGWCDYCAEDLLEKRPSVHSEETRPQVESVCTYVGSVHESPYLMGSEAPDYPVVEVSSCSERFYKNVCKICSFKTDKDSVMISHLRMHMRTYWQCDYCSESIPNYRPHKQVESKHHKKLGTEKVITKGSAIGKIILLEG